MTVVTGMHETYGARFRDRGSRRVVDDYGRPERTHRAVRNGVGVIEMGYGVVVIEGDDRVEFVDDTVSNRVPATEGSGVYALLLDPQGRIDTDLYVYNAGERLLCFTPPERAPVVAREWADNVFIRDVEVREASAEFAVFGVHGPNSTEKVASVLNGAASPEPELTFVRGSMGGEGVTVIAGDGLTGEEGYEIVCAAAAAGRVFETLLSFGMNAVPFGYRTWETLTVEAGTPLFDTELRDRLPNVAGARNGLDFAKGCFVGQEVVSKVENRGRPSERIVGLEPDRLPDRGAAVFDGDEAVGTVTRGVESPSLDAPIALAAVDFGTAATDLTVRVDGDAVAAERVPLPFVEGSARSARLPTYAE